VTATLEASTLEARVSFEAADSAQGAWGLSRIKEDDYEKMIFSKSMRPTPKIERYSTSLYS
jgi:hypothetical protein